MPDMAQRVGPSARLGGWLLGLVLVLELMVPAGAQAAVPAGFQESIVFSGLTEPTAVQFASDGRVFIAEKSGLIKVFDSLTDTSPTQFADLRTNVHNYWDRGLLGLALPPGFPTDPSVYVLYTYDHILGDDPDSVPQWGAIDMTSDGCPGPTSTPPGPGATSDGCVVSGRLSKLTANGNVWTGTEQVLIEDWCQQFPSHSVGSLAFGTDGALYVSGGDGASFNAVDYGQEGAPFWGSEANPCHDPGPHAAGAPIAPPGAEGGALRSQDLRTPGTPGGSDYASLVLGAGPAGYWRLGESTGTSIVDAAGSNTGQYVGGFTLAQPGALAGDANTAVRFNGSTGNGTVPDAAALDVADGPFSVEFWLKLATTSGTQGIVDKGAFSFWIGVEQSKLTFYRSNVGPLITRETGTVDTNWHHYVVTRNGSASKIYKDGLDVTGSVASIPAMQSTTAPLLIGKDVTSTERLNGTLDELAMYRRVLSGQEAADHYNAGITGTGGSADPVSLDGAILRLDPSTGAALPSNPHFSSPDPNARRIIADGLRNPFRIGARPGTNEIWLGDVGWNTWEEINRIAATGDSVAENFGWPCYEGVGHQSGYDGADLALCENLYASGAVTAPYYTYNHGSQVVPGETCPTGGSAVAGIAFYPESGGSFPAAYAGALFFADNTRDCIWVMFKGANGQPDPATRQTFVAGAANPVDLKIGPGNDLYYVDFGGSLRRIRFTTANQSPTAVIQAAPTSGAAPLAVSFNGTGSSDPEGGALTYAWDFTNDGTNDATGPTTSFTYPAGTHTARLTVTDPQGLTGGDTELITVSGTSNAPPVPVISSPTASTTWAVNQQINFSGSATDPEDGVLGQARLSWSLVLQHCPSNCHPHTIQSWPGVGSGLIDAPDHEYPSYLELTLTATDSQNQSASTTVRLDPRTVQLTMSSVPSGLQLTIGSRTQVAPFTVTAIQGSNNSLSAPTPQDLAGTRYAFTSWSDGGSQSHNVVAGTSNATYTATYQAISADLRMIKTGARAAGSTTITYSLAVTNLGPGSAAAVGISDVLHSRLTFVSYSSPQGSCGYASGTRTFSCSLGNLANQQAITVTLVVQVNKLNGTVANTASASTSSPDLNTGNNASTVTLRLR